MEKFYTLFDYIIRIPDIYLEQIRWFVDGIRVIPSGRDLGFVRKDGKDPVRQIELGRMNYDCAISITNYSGRDIDFIARFTTWLAEHDSEREGLAVPELDISINEQTWNNDIYISIDFEEYITAIEDPHGNIPFLNTFWTVVSSPTITPAERFQMYKGKP